MQSWLQGAECYCQLIERAAGRPLDIADIDALSSVMKPPAITSLWLLVCTKMPPIVPIGNWLSTAVGTVFDSDAIGKRQTPATFIAAPIGPMRKTLSVPTGFEPFDQVMARS